MKTLALATGLFTILLGTGCDEERRQISQYGLTFLATDDRGQEIGNIPIWVGTTNLGLTDSTGSLSVEVNARDGQRFPLDAPCPSGYDAQDVPEEVVFLDTRGLAGEKNANLSLRIVCKRQMQIAAIVVHADGHEDMPILVDGVPYGTTGPGGFAHVRFEGVSSTQFEVSLDTSRCSNLVPRNPRQEMQLGSEDGLFIFEPVFSKAKPKATSRSSSRRRRSRRSAEVDAPKSTRPIKID